MSAGKNGDQSQADDVVFAANHAAKCLFQLGGFMGYGDRSFRGHLLDFTLRRWLGGVTDVTGPVVGYHGNQSPR
jgi:hypothetical protein